MLVVIWDIYETPQRLLESKWARESGDFASEGYVKHSSFVALSWHTFLIEPSGFWNLRKWGTLARAHTHTHTYTMMSWVMQLIMETEKDAVICVCLLLVLFYCLKSPFFFFLIVWPLGLEIRWTEFWEIQWNVVIRNCFLLIFSPPSKLCIWIALGMGGEWGKGKHPVTYIFRSFVVSTQKLSELIMMASRG